jgi:protein-S-isoprenylcysteine O-methyltransferase Ste14
MRVFLEPCDFARKITLAKSQGSERRREEDRMTFRQLAQRIRVPAGFVLAPLLIISARPTRGSLMAGAVVAAVGLAIRAWASGYLRKNQELTTSGPYAHTRNPLYLGTFLLGTGVAIGAGSVWFIALFAALYLLIYVPVMLAEAETLGQLFPADYEQYSSRVPLFLPRVTPYRAAPRAQVGGGYRPEPRRRFDLSQYLRHREYRALIGFIAVYALIAAKMFLLGAQ